MSGVESPCVLYIYVWRFRLSNDTNYEVTAVESAYSYLSSTRVDLCRHTSRRESMRGKKVLEYFLAIKTKARTLVHTRVGGSREGLTI